ncbi:hypothetical protein II906_04375 [bacterium]|nr:hypothetical protein [bacterium]
MSALKILREGCLCADVYLKYGNVVSKTAGIGHEWEQYKNPPEEWNMDSWNNNQGIEIAKEMIRDYGDSLSTISPEQRNDIIADKVMQRMRSGQLITHPTELRYYKAGVEKNIFSFQRFLEKYGLKKPKGN